MKIFSQNESEEMKISSQNESEEMKISSQKDLEMKISSQKDLEMKISNRCLLIRNFSAYLLTPRKKMKNWNSEIE